MSAQSPLPANRRRVTVAATALVQGAGGLGTASLCVRGAGKSPQTLAPHIHHEGLSFSWGSEGCDGRD